MHEMFQDREDAGKRLAKKLSHLHPSDTVVLTIPRGGVPVAAAVAHRLRLEWGIIVARKLPVPSNPEAGFGAITADGPVVLNEPMVHGLQLSARQIDVIADLVKAEVVKQAEIYARVRPAVDITGRTVVILDDGLASGYTMLAAIRSVREKSPARIIAAAPVASRSAARLIQEAADECVFEIVSPAVPFAVADFYAVWHDLSDQDILPILGEEQIRL